MQPRLKDVADEDTLHIRSTSLGTNANQTHDMVKMHFHFLCSSWSLSVHIYIYIYIYIYIHKDRPLLRTVVAGPEAVLILGFTVLVFMRKMEANANQVLKSSNSASFRWLRLHIAAGANHKFYFLKFAS